MRRATGFAMMLWGVLCVGAGCGMDGTADRNSSLTPSDGGDSGLVGHDAGLPDLLVVPDAFTEGAPL